MAYMCAQFVELSIGSNSVFIDMVAYSREGFHLWVLLDAIKAIVMWLTFSTHGLIIAVPLSSPIPPSSPCQSSLPRPGWFVGDLNHESYSLFRVCTDKNCCLVCGRFKIPMIGHYCCLDMVPNHNFIFDKYSKKKIVVWNHIQTIS